uniref:Solute carrier family 25 member 40 n=1 Tax=Cyprinus carpio TaxID=7962 RepID=A0A8C2AWJ1_CYPCA
MSSQKSSSVPTKDITPVQQMTASCSGAVITSLFVTPLDVVKIRLQAQNSSFPKGKCFVYCNGLMDHICVCENGNSKAWYKTPGCFTGTLDAFIKIIHVEGVRSLWSGLPPTLVMAVPATVIYFTCYDQLCSVLKHRMGDRSDYKGKAWLCQYYNCSDPTFAITFMAGALSGSFASVITLPFDVVKTRRQVELGELQTIKLSTQVSSSTYHVMKRIVAENGVSGLF